MAIELFDVLTNDGETRENDPLLENLPETWTEVLSMITPPRNPGRYNMSLTSVSVFTSTNTSVLFQFRFNGGTWNDFIFEPKDKEDKTPRHFEREVPYHNGGTMTMEIQARKETTVGTFSIPFIETSIARIG